jgi:hypothetical protein
MAGAVVLIVEGTGAYAELGSFSVLEPLSKKLILIVNDTIIEKETFVNLGPIKYLDDQKSHVFRYNWNVHYKVNEQEPHKVSLVLTEPKDGVNNVVELIYDKIKITIPKIEVKSTILQTERVGHLCFVVAELVYIFSALKLHELKKYLNEYFGYRELTNQRLKTALYILEKLEFIKPTYTGDRYYVPMPDNTGFIKYSFDSALEKERMTSAVFKGSLIAFYADYDKERFNAILRT